MRRAVLTLSGTVAGLAALFSFKTHVPGVAPVAEPSTPAGLSVSAPATPTASAAGSARASPSAAAKNAPEGVHADAPARAGQDHPGAHASGHASGQGAVKLGPAEGAADHCPSE